MNRLEQLKNQTLDKIEAILDPNNSSSDGAFDVLSYAREEIEKIVNSLFDELENNETI